MIYGLKTNFGPGTRPKFLGIGCLGSGRSQRLGFQLTRTAIATSIYDFFSNIYLKLLRKSFMGSKPILCQEQDPNSLVSCISSQEGRRDIVFTFQLKRTTITMFIYDYLIIQEKYSLKCSEKELWAINRFWVRRETQIPWYFLSRLRKVIETSFSAQKIRNCHFIFNLSSNI